MSRDFANEWINAPTPLVPVAGHGDFGYHAAVAETFSSAELRINGAQHHLGGNTIGRRTDRRETFAILDAYASVGGTNIDLADAYGGDRPGLAEAIAGEWLSTRRRDRLRISSKVGLHPEFRGSTPMNIRAAVEQTLLRLKTDYLDVYYSHVHDPRVDLAETVEAFADLVQSGKIVSIGLSNYPPHRISEWIEVAGSALAPTEIQVLYNLAEEDSSFNEINSICRQHSISLISYCTLARGMLTDRDHDMHSSSPRLARYTQDPLFLSNVENVRRLCRENKTNITVAALLLATNNSGVSGIISSATRIEHIEELAEASRCRVDDNLAKDISRIPRVLRDPDLT